MVDDVALDLEFVRAQFPPLEDGWAFFDNAAGSYVPDTVIDCVTSYMRECQVQPGPIGKSKLAADRVAAGQRAIAATLNAEPDEVIVGPSTTRNIYVLSNAVRSWFDEGDEIIVTDLDHEANNTPWRRLAESGVTVKEWRFDLETGRLDASNLGDLLTERTRLVCFSACSNVTGTINDVAAITARAHEAGALVCVDAVALGSHRAIDVKALDVDFLACSIYKLYGPHIAALYGKREHLLGAKGQSHYFFDEDDIPLKLNPGGVNHELTAALSGVVDYFEGVHAHHFDAAANDLHTRIEVVYDLIAEAEEQVATPFIDYVNSEPRIRLLGLGNAQKGERVPTFAFDVPGADLAAIQADMGDNRVNIGLEHYYAPRVLEAYGMDPDRGALRASMVHYNTPDEVRQLIAALGAALG